MIVHNEYHHLTPCINILGKLLLIVVDIRYHMELRDIIYLIVAVILAIVAFYVIIWLLPVIIILIIAYIIYMFLKSGE
ncbi:putative conserved hypothetical protein [Methanothermobacter sp. MT-2]|nr:putative conserved hypothetical protein [Methanothermobacter sp. MT-2]